jgi:hypothetical protein
MRCLSCNKVLSGREATRKSTVSGMYYDLCDRCFSTIADQVTSVENPNLQEDGEEDYGEPSSNE